MTVNEVKVQFALGLLNIDDLVDMLKPVAPHWGGIIPSVPKELLVYLSDYKYSRVRYYVADNPNTPIEILATLSKDKNIFVRMTADCTIRRIERCETVE